MGTSIDPPFANIYFHYKLRTVMKIFASEIVLHMRYIDDEFMVIRGSNTYSLIKELNGCSNLKITFEGFGYKVDFLDLKVYKGDRFMGNEILDTCIHTKVIPNFLYLNVKSSHPEQVFNGLIKANAVYSSTTQIEKQFG